MMFTSAISQIIGSPQPNGPILKTGPVFQDAGGAAASWDPRTITTGTVLLWLDPSQGVTMNGSNQVSQWDDQSASGFDFVQADTAQMYVYSATAINGTPGLVSTSSRRMSYTGTFSSTGGRYLFATVVYPTQPTTGVNTMCEFDPTAYGTVAPYLNGYCYDAFGRTVGRGFDGSVIAPATTAFVYTLYNQTGEWTAYKDGTQFYTEVPAGALGWPASELWLGSKLSGSLNGTYGDFIVVDSGGSALSGTDFNYIINGMKAKAGIT